MCSEERKVIIWPDKGCDGLAFRVQEVMHESFPRKFDLNAISNLLFVNKSYMCRVFKRETGMTMLQYYNELRCEHARRLLLHSKLGIAYISVQVGFCSPSQFCYVFKKVVGKTPCEYRRSSLQALKEKQ